MNPDVVHGRRSGEQPSYTKELAELLRIIVWAGVPTGIVVIGGGSRLAMFLLRLTSRDARSRRRWARRFFSRP